MIYWLKPSWAQLLQKDPQALLSEIGEPKTADECFGTALAHDEMGDGMLAERHLRLALQYQLGHIPAAYALGLKSLQRKREREGRSLLRRALRLDSRAAETCLLFLRDLKNGLTEAPRVVEISVWLLKEVELAGKAQESTYFQLGKLLFEKSHYEDSAKYLLKAIGHSEVSSEAVEYLSYIYEHLYKGEELIEKTLELADIVPNRSDLFFNLAMVCQHEQRRMELALHFFYLASREDPADPGLKFSLEQAAIELMHSASRIDVKDRDFLLMLAHLYQGSVGVAKKYADGLQGWKYPQDFEHRMPSKLWHKWLAVDTGVLGQALRTWFGGEDFGRKLHSLTRR